MKKERLRKAFKAFNVSAASTDDLLIMLTSCKVELDKRYKNTGVTNC